MNTSHAPCSFVVTSLGLQGLRIVLEDGNTLCSHPEALMWADVNPFSPLMTGAVLAPYV